jgi:hypothetical protein
MSIFLTGRRSATTTLAQIHAYDLNLCTALHCSRRTLTLAPRSCPATSSTNALMGVGCHQPVRLPRANPHSARGTTACHFPRFRSLKAFGRRPRCTPRRRDRPASETLNKLRHGSKSAPLPLFPLKTDMRSRDWHVSLGPHEPTSGIAVNYIRYSMTSSAVARRIGGTLRPSALAVLRLIASSYLLGVCTGRSAALSPLRMRST